MAEMMCRFLDEQKVENVVCIDMRGKSIVLDAIVIGTGRSRRHIASVAKALKREFKKTTAGDIIVDAPADSDWAAVCCGGVVVHLFSGTESRAYYDLERISYELREKIPQT